MLIIPFDRPLDWRRPPLATLALVLANVAVYLGLQLDDGARLREAVNYYYSASTLAERELPRYRDYLIAEGETAFVARWGDALGDPASPWLFRMLGDGPFMARLRAGKVITPDDAGYGDWRRERRRFETLLARSSVMGWGLRAAEPTAATLFSHMFLHGGPVHLAGNMLFLLAVGFLVEMTLGALAYLGLYLLGGLGAAGLFVLMNPASALPLVGASGAIAGLMGMYAVIYGLRRINFFYWVLVYFDYVRAPAILLLPLWLGNELFQYLNAGERAPVAYMAHVGGLLAGAGLAFGYKQLGGSVDEDYIAEKARQARIEADLEQVAQALRALAPEQAMAALRRLQAQIPDDGRVILAAYRLHRFRPDTAAYHDAARRVIAAPEAVALPAEAWLWAYRDYRRRARPRARMSAPMITAAAERLLGLGEHREAARLVAVMAGHPQRFPQAPDMLLRLANAARRAGARAEARRYYQWLQQGFPGTQAARLAAQQLASAGKRGH